MQYLYIISREYGQKDSGMTPPGSTDLQNSSWDMAKFLDAQRKKNNIKLSSICSYVYIIYIL